MAGFSCRGVGHQKLKLWSERPVFYRDAMCKGGLLAYLRRTNSGGTVMAQGLLESIRAVAGYPTDWYGWIDG
jgi:hypothetical protein